jgi:hypothetical protein
MTKSVAEERTKSKVDQGQRTWQITVFAKYLCNSHTEEHPLSSTKPGKGGIFEAEQRVGRRHVTIPQIHARRRCPAACKETHSAISVPYFDFFHGFLDRNARIISMLIYSLI